MTKELKQCPFCGGNGSYSNAGFGFIVKCKKCGAKTSIQESGKEAADTWNSRAFEDAESKRLIGALKAIKKIVDKPPLSIYDAARIYAECCEALGEKNDA